MTDDLTLDGGTDELESRLRSLRSDTDGVILADPSSVRRHGDRRRRMTQAGTVLGVAVLAVGVVGVAGTLTDRPGAAPPAASPTPSVSASTTVVAADPFLRAGDVAAIGPNESFLRGEEATGEPSLRCLSDPASWGATSNQSLGFYGDVEGAFVETVLQFPDEASAEAGAARLQQDFAVCPQGDPEEASVSDRSGQLAVGSQAYQFSRLTTPTADAGLAYTEVAVARNGTVVVVLDWVSLGSPVADPGWAWTPEQVGIALDRAVA